MSLAAIDYYGCFIGVAALQLGVESVRSRRLFKEGEREATPRPAHHL